MKTVLKRIFWFGFLGTVLNMMVAWVCALWLPIPVTLSSNRVPASALGEIVSLPAHWPKFADGSSVQGNGLQMWQFFLTVDPESGKTENHRFMVSVFRAGWPFPSLQYTYRGDSQRRVYEFADRWTSVVPIPSWLRPNFITKDRGAFFSHLPIRPIKYLFLFNTIFYGLLLWLCYAIFLTLRGNRRKRMGLCSRCSYPIGAGTRCPECGKRSA